MRNGRFEISVDVCTPAFSEAWVEDARMPEKNIVREKSFLLALHAISLSRILVKEHREFVLSKQLLRSATSIGANVEEALRGHSRKDFLAKNGDRIERGNGNTLLDPAHSRITIRKH